MLQRVSAVVPPMDAAPGECELRLVKSSGAVERMAEAWERAKHYAGVDDKTASAARDALKFAMIDAVDEGSPGPFACPRRLVLCFVHAAHLWCDGATNGGYRRDDLRKLADSIVEEIKAWRAGIVGGAS
jgi:hypothetical protein